jgi:hypothetical protein
VPVDGGWVWVEEVALLLLQKSRLVENSLLAVVGAGAASVVAVVGPGIRIARMALAISGMRVSVRLMVVSTQVVHAILRVLFDVQQVLMVVVRVVLRVVLLRLKVAPEQEVLVGGPAEREVYVVVLVREPVEFSCQKEVQLRVAC